MCFCVGLWVGEGDGLVVGTTDGVRPALCIVSLTHTLTHTHRTHIACTELNLALVALFMPSLPVVTFYSSHMFELSVGEVSGWVGI